MSDQAVLGAAHRSALWLLCTLMARAGVFPSRLSVDPSKIRTRPVVFLLALTGNIGNVKMES
jgi:hypothetical protein